MSDPTAAQRDSHELAIELLSPETCEALLRSARLSGRTVHEEAEHIIKTHIAASSHGGD
jgi:hypothetical protein